MKNKKVILFGVFIISMFLINLSVDLTSDFKSGNTTLIAMFQQASAAGEDWLDCPDGSDTGYVLEIEDCPTGSTNQHYARCNPVCDDFECDPSSQTDCD
jgi:hypothetical protein